MTDKAGKFAVPSDPADRRDWIITQLKRGGSSMRQVALKIGVTPQSVQQTLYLPSARIELALAKELSVPVHMLFPDRYRPDGSRLRRTRGPDRAAA